MTKTKNQTTHKLQSFLHDSVSPHTYLGLALLKKFTEKLTENTLSDEQERQLFQMFIHMTKAHENIDKIIHAEALENLSEEAFFPTLDEVVSTYGLGKIILEFEGDNMSSTLSTRLGICLLELTLNQLRHNHWAGCKVQLKSFEKTTIACIVYTESDALIPENTAKSTQAEARLGLALIEKRIASWEGKIQHTYDAAAKTLRWDITLPTN